MHKFIYFIKLSLFHEIFLKLFYIIPLNFISVEIIIKDKNKEFLNIFVNFILKINLQYFPVFMTISKFNSRIMNIS